jgi:hypothetical protein
MHVTMRCIIYARDHVKRRVVAVYLQLLLRRQRRCCCGWSGRGGPCRFRVDPRSIFTRVLQFLMRDRKSVWTYGCSSADEPVKRSAGSMRRRPCISVCILLTGKLFRNTNLHERQLLLGHNSAVTLLKRLWARHVGELEAEEARVSQEHFVLVAG